MNLLTRYQVGLRSESGPNFYLSIDNTSKRFWQGDLRVSTITPEGQVWVGDVVRIRVHILLLWTSPRKIYCSQQATFGTFQPAIHTRSKPKTLLQTVPNFSSFSTRDHSQKTLLFNWPIGSLIYPNLSSRRTSEWLVIWKHLTTYRNMSFTFSLVSVYDAEIIFARRWSWKCFVQRYLLRPTFPTT